MTVQSATSRADYDGNGVTVDFAVTFRFLDKTHLQVIRSVIATGAETVLTLDSAGADGYTVTGAGAASGGEVTVVTPPVGAGATQERITILRNVPATQLLDFIANDAFPAESHERGLDLLTMLHGQQGEVLDRAMVVPASTTGFSAQLPTPVALRPLVVNAAGTAFEMGDTDLTGDMLLRGDIHDGGYRYGDDDDPANGGFFTDDDPTTKLHKFRDRVFFGDAVDYTGRRTAPYGGDWLTENGASYWMKNAQVAVLGDETEGRYAFLAAARGGGIGGAFVILNETGTAGRAIYAEAMHKSNGNASVAIETATSNITATDFNPDSYSMGGARGLYVAAFNGGMGYTVGDADTPTTEATLPPAAAIDIAGYSTTATRWRKGIVFRNGSLYRGTGDGSTGEATAIAMAQGHALVWNSAAGVRGGVVRCDTTTSGQDTGLLLTNNEVQLLGTSEVPLARFTRDVAGAGAVNWPRIINSRTGVNPQIIADGSDTNLGFDIKSKGTGNVRLVDGGGAVKFQINSTGIGFYGTTPIAKPAPTGSRGGNAALASLLTQLANLGLITDSTSA